MLFSTVNTQSQPKLDPLADFWKLIYDELDKEPECLDTLEGFINTISKKLDRKDLEKVKSKKLDKLDEVWHLLKLTKGWGDKTAALFVKSCCNIHWDKANKNIKFWHDFPPAQHESIIYLPVDRVIIHIFSELNIDEIEKGNKFEKINKYLLEKYKTPNEMLIWDDLWFWGFITQKSVGNDRLLEWNLAKYYAVFHTPKDRKSIKEIEALAKKFIEIIKADLTLIASQ